MKPSQIKESKCTMIKQPMKNPNAVSDSPMCNWHAQEIEELKSTVFGNGKTGLKEEVIILRQKVNLLVWLNGVVALGMIGYMVSKFMEKVL